MRTTSIVSWVLIILIEAGLLVLTFLEGVRASLLGPGPQSFYILLNTNLAVIILWIGLRADHLERRVEKDVTGMAARLEQLATSSSSVDALVDQEFYMRFADEIGKARVGVAMTHLDTHPPSRTRGTSADAYYDQLPKIVRSHRPVRFRRVERASPPKKEWLEWLVREFVGVANFSMGVLLVPSVERRLGIVSVQLIDEAHAVLAAVAEHDSSLGPRDVWITDQKAAALWKEYYEITLWRDSTKVIENGTLNEPEWNKVLKFIDNQCPNT